jgi:transposase InsO family protein
MSETIMLLNVPGCFNGSTVLVEPIRTLTERSIAMARSVSKPTAGKVNCRLLNPTSRPITLKRNAIIATLQSVSNDCVSPFNDDLTGHVDVKINNRDDLTNEVDVHAVIAELGIDLAPSVLSTERRRQLAKLIASFSDIFAKDISQLGKTTAFSFKVETGDQPPIRKRMYRYSPEQKAEIDRQITEMLKSDVIFPSNSMWQSPVVLVHRKNSDSNLPPPPPRFAIDFRGLNAVTKPLAQASVRFDDVIDAVAGAKADTYTVLDFRSGFYQIPLADKESMDRCSFVCHSGVYSYKVLPFGVRNGSVAFQTMMTSLLRHMLFRYVICYTDDLIVYSDAESHISILEQIFIILRRNNLKLAPSKCQFARDSVVYLSHVITPQGCKPCPGKIAAITTYKMCENQAELRTWLGMTSYWRRYIKDYAKICQPLTKLLQKGAKWVWTDECTKAFETLREKLVTAPILALPNFDYEFHITTDASGQSVGYYLSQFIDGKEHVISYGGRQLRGTEKTWGIADLEGLALITAIREYHPYLSAKFTVHTDNIALQWLNSIKQATGRLFRWSILLQGYNFDILHKSSKLNPVADALSRRAYTDNDSSVPTYGLIEDNDIMSIELDSNNDDLDVHKPRKRKMYRAIIEYDCSPSRQDIDPTNAEVAHESTIICTLTDSPNLAQMQRDCSELRPLIEYLESGTLPANDNEARRVILESERYVLDNEILYHLFTPRRKTVDTHTRQIAVPKSQRADVLRAFHDDNFGGSHAGIDRMYANMKLRFHWKNMWTDCRLHCLSCDRCQRAKRSVHSRKAPLLPIPPNKLFDRWHIDFLKMPTVDGYTRLLVAVDAYSKWVEAFPVRTEKADETAEVLYSQLFSRYGAPTILVSDRSKTFLGNLIGELCKRFKIKQHFTSAFHAMSDGQVERENQNILNTLRIYTAGEANWPRLLPGALAALRASVRTHGSGYSPFYLLFHTEMQLPIQNSLAPPTEKGNLRGLEEINRSIEITHKIATQNIKRQQERYKLNFDKTAAYPQFQVGDTVLLHNPKVPPGKSPKFHIKYVGPYYITAKYDNFTYSIRHCETNKMYGSRVHANRLRLYRSPHDRVYNAGDTSDRADSPRRDSLNQAAILSGLRQRRRPRAHSYHRRQRVTRVTTLNRARHATGTRLTNCLQPVYATKIGNIRSNGAMLMKSQHGKMHPM